MIILTKSIFNENKNNPRFIQDVKYSHRCLDVNSNFKHFKAFGVYPEYYTFTNDQFIQDAKVIHAKMKHNRLVEIEKSNNIHFIAMGCDFETKSIYVNNHRIRCSFYNNDNKLIFLEVGTHRDNNYMRVDFSLDVRGEKYNYLGLERKNIKLRYTYKNLLNFINSNYDCNFEGIEIERVLISPDDLINSTNN